MKVTVKEISFAWNAESYFVETLENFYFKSYVIYK